MKKKDLKTRRDLRNYILKIVAEYRYKNQEISKDILDNIYYYATKYDEKDYIKMFLKKCKKTFLVII